MNRSTHSRRVAALLALLWLGAVACSDSARRLQTASANELNGVPLDPPRAKPELALTATDGKPFDLQDDTRGKLTFLFFGFTSCPDICPVHMANLAAALSKLSYEERERTRVVFVSVDPERDTPERIREWLDNFDRAFIGVRGSMSDINRAEEQLGLPPSSKLPVNHHDGSYGVGHSTQILVFHPTIDSAYVTYPFGTRQSDWAADLPRLLEHGGRP
jgi:protein SCO1/2